MIAVPLRSVSGAGRAAVGVVHRVDPPHRAHRLALLVGVGEDPGETGGDEQGVAEIARKADLVEDRGHRAVDVDRRRLADGSSQRRLERRRGRQVVARDAGVAGDRQEAVEPWVADLVLAMAEPGDSPAVRPLDARRTRRRPRSARRSRVRRRSRRPRRSTCMAESTAAPWNSPSVSSPAAAAACSVAPPEIAVRAARTDGAPAPWSMLATMTASISRAVRGSGSSPV